MNAQNHSTPSFPDAADARMHEMLRREGPTLELPDAPTAADVARWTHAPWSRVHSPAEHRAPARRARFARGVTRLVSGLAAVVLVAAGLYVALGRTSSARASTILGALRSSTFSGLHVTFKGLRVNGFEATGEARVRFAGEHAAADLFDPSGKTPVVDVRALALQAHVTGGNGSEMPGLIGDVKVGLGADGSWAYFTSSTPDVVARRLGPVSEAVAAALPGGVLVEFNGTASIGGSGSTSAISPLTSEQISKLKEDAHSGMNVRVLDGSTLTLPPSGSSTQVMVVRDGAGDNSDAIGRILPLLRGQAGVVQLQELARSLGDGSARDAKVTAQADGSYVLTVQGKTDATRDATVRIGYREGAGIEWIELLGIGDAPGGSAVVRVESFDGEIAPDLLDASRLPAPALRLDARGK